MISQWDEAETGRSELGHLSALWSDLSGATGATRLGVARIQIRPLNVVHPGTHRDGGGRHLLRPRRNRHARVHAVADARRPGSGAGVTRGTCRDVRLASGGQTRLPRLPCGDRGLTLLAHGERRSNDLIYYPRSNKIDFRGVGVIARLEHVSYHVGEESTI